MTNAAWSLIAHLLGRGSLVVASILLARSLKTTEFAAYSYFQLTVSMLAAYSAMGMGVAASRFFAEAGHVPEDRTPPIGTLWVLSSFAGLVFALAVLGLPTSWVEGGLELPRWLLSLGVFVMTLGVVPAGGILGLERYREATLAAAAAAVIVVTGSLLAGRAGSAAGAMWAFVLASLVQTAGNAWVVVRKIGLPSLIASNRYRAQDLGKIAGFAGPMTVVSLLSASGAWVVGRIILAGNSGEQGFALYIIGLQWFSLALLLPGMLSRVILPRLIRGRLELGVPMAIAPSVLVRQGAYLTLATAIAMCLVGALLSPWLWALYGIDYGPGAWLIIAFMAAAIPAAPVNTLGNAILADDGQMGWLLATGVWFACLIVLAGASAPLGVWSGAIAHGIAYSLMIVFVVRMTRQRNLV